MTAAEHSEAPALSTLLRSKGVVTIPQAAREALHLEIGDHLIVDVEDGHIVLTPAAPLRPRDQAWFWTKEWQAKEAEADNDLSLGRVDRYSSDADFLASLDED